MYSTGPADRAIYYFRSQTNLEISRNIHLNVILSQTEFMLEFLLFKDINKKMMDSSSMKSSSDSVTLELRGREKRKGGTLLSAGIQSKYSKPQRKDYQFG